MNKASYCFGLLALSFVILVVHYLSIVFGSINNIVQHIPDDAFYYIVIAMHWAKLGYPTFDGGVSVTSGFHPLMELLCVGLAKLFSDKDTLVRATVAMTAMITLITVGSVGVYALRRKKPLLALVLATSILSFSVINNGASAMEWPLVLAFTAAIFALLLQDGPFTGRHLGILVLLGMFASLARTDFLGTAVALFGAAMVLWVFWKDRRYALPAICVIVGAVIGIGLALGLYYVETGDAIQGSARIKALWNAYAGMNPLPFILVCARTVFYLPGLEGSGVARIAAHIREISAALIVLVMGLGVLIFMVRRRRAGTHLSTPAPLFSQPEKLVLLASVFCIVGYCAVYATNALGMQIWYSAHVTIPALIVFYFLARQVQKMVGQGVAIVIVSLIFCLNLASYAASDKIYVQQVSGRYMGEALAKQFPNARVGMSDTGIMNFFAGGNLINLDGLTNNDIAAYAPDRLYCYFLDKKIEYANGFGTTTLIMTHPRPMGDYVTWVPVPYGDGQTFSIGKIDWDILASYPECASEASTK